MPIPPTQSDDLDFIGAVVDFLPYQGGSIFDDRYLEAFSDFIPCFHISCHTRALNSLLTARQMATEVVQPTPAPEQQDDFPLKFCTVCASNQNRFVAWFY